MMTKAKRLNGWAQLHDGSLKVTVEGDAKRMREHSIAERLGVLAGIALVAARKKGTRAERIERAFRKR